MQVYWEQDAFSEAGKIISANECADILEAYRQHLENEPDHGVVPMAVTVALQTDWGTPTARYTYWIVNARKTEIGKLPVAMVYRVAPTNSMKRRNRTINPNAKKRRAIR